PKIYLEDGSVAGAEALVRWVREDGRVIPPDEFIPLFEKNGFITKIDIFVLRRVCRWLKEREERGEPLFKISVNLSGVDVRDEQIVSYIADQVEEFGISPEYLEFELTETAFLSDTEQIFSVLKRLQDMGFTTSIDDFGSGYSIMNMVAEIPTDIVKMDCAFVQNCGKSDRGREFLSQLVLMVRKMGFVALCEGIETEDHLNMVEKMGCELGQGYYFSRPVPQPEFEEWLKKQRFHPGEICGIV
ncbi:EAL domain-containing protein, partial [Enterocloster asparagiformis]|uniref:EAL domain-containing protein n=1 Tax=Enterocloster asparagiformis TaxID=333367 RepID=UPI002A812092